MRACRRTGSSGPGPSRGLGCESPLVRFAPRPQSRSPKGPWPHNPKGLSESPKRAPRPLRESGSPFRVTRGPASRPAPGATARRACRRLPAAAANRQSVAQAGDLSWVPTHCRGHFDRRFPPQCAASGVAYLVKQPLTEVDDVWLSVSRRSSRAARARRLAAKKCSKAVRVTIRVTVRVTVRVTIT
jgi:hypothetical protein